MNEIINTQPRANTTNQVMVASRAVQEVNAAMIAAKNFPRDEAAAIERIKRACRRKGLAEVACYEIPKGGQKVTGPSIRLAEALAQNWGNLQAGVTELERVGEESVVVSYCVDLESNVRIEKTFTVRHIRDTTSGGKKLTSERDIYEAIANAGARRLRACILAVIPGDIQDLAVEECERTLSGDGEPIEQKIEKLLDAFRKIGVSKVQIENKIGSGVGALTQQGIAKLRGVYTAIRDGFTTKEEQFGGKTSTEKPTIESLASEPVWYAERDSTAAAIEAAKTIDDVHRCEEQFLDKHNDADWRAFLIPLLKEAFERVGDA